MDENRVVERDRVEDDGVMTLDSQAVRDPAGHLGRSAVPGRGGHKDAHGPTSDRCADSPINLDHRRHRAIRNRAGRPTWRGRMDWTVCDVAGAGWVRCGRRGVRRRRGPA